MDIPSRTRIRSWLASLSRNEILEKLAVIREEHGAGIEADCRHFLNHEKKRVACGHELFPKPQDGMNAMTGEESLMNEHEAQKKLYGAKK